MRRRRFFGALAGLATAPVIAKLPAKSAYVPDPRWALGDSDFTVECWLPAPQWEHRAVVREDGVVRQYLNGRQVSDAGPIASEPFNEFRLTRAARYRVLENEWI